MHAHNEYVVVFHCFNFYFPMSNDMLIYHSYIFFCEVFVQIFAHLRICFHFCWLGRVFMYLGYNLLSDLPITYQYSSIYWIFSSILWLAFCLFNGVFWREGFNFNEVQFINSLFYGVHFFVAKEYLNV